MDLYTFTFGSSPLLISIPHAGTYVPEDIAERFTIAARRLPDTDWCVHRLYEFAGELGASVIQANYSRYVVDLNRSCDSGALYVAHATSPVCATHTFKGEPIYLGGAELEAEEIENRVALYWRPYHANIAAELRRLRQQHGLALLWDAHSIQSEIPALFTGILPEFNLGTRDNATCPAAISEALLEIVTRDGKFGAVLNGRFRGGYITQHYGQPAESVYAVQLELAQRAYMDETITDGWDPARAQSAVALIKRLLARFMALK